MNKDLNNIFIPVADRDTDGTPTDFSFNGPVQFDTIGCYFKAIEERLIELIEDYQHGAIFGCIAWLTSIPILTALSKCENVQIVVQKEDFLRPDGPMNYWKQKLHKLYASIKFGIERHEMGGLAGSLSVCGEPTVEAIRCVGNHNSTRNPAFPRSHHKFLVFCRTEIEKEEYEGNFYSVNTIIKPTAVWTGSFNITQNATKSFENVILMKDMSGKNPIINAYLKEYHQVFALSEPLNWENDWCEPEYRIGT